MADQKPELKEIATVDQRIETMVARPAVGLPTPDEIRVIEYLGQTYHASGLLPAGVRNWQAAVIAIQAGRELGVPPTVAIREIYVVNGRPSCSAQLMMSLIRRAYGPGAIRVKSATPTEVTVEYREPGWDGVSTFTFAEADARKAGLWGGKNDNWNKYPRAMLRSRAVSEVARMAFPDAILGMYTPEELGAVVDGDGRPVITGTVIDHDTGEVLNTKGRYDDRSVPVSLDAEKVMRRLHAVARKAGIGHEQLSDWAHAKHKVQSLKDVDVSVLDDLATWIDKSPEAAAKTFHGHYPGIETPKAEPAPEPDDLDDIEAIEVDGGSY